MRYHIFDLDGCISDDRFRRHLLPDYDAYHKLCMQDDPMNMSVFEEVRELCESIDESLLFITARPDTYEEQTRSWIKTNLGLCTGDYALFMRPEYDTSASPVLKVQRLRNADIHYSDIVAAYDDRRDVLDAYENFGIVDTRLLGAADSADQVLDSMACTFRGRNAVYGDNWRLVGRVMEVLHGPGSRHPATRLVGSAEQMALWSLWETLIGKLTRFANSGLTHEDSIHDLAVYAAMIEVAMKEAK